MVYITSIGVKFGLLPPQHRDHRQAKLYEISRLSKAKEGTIQVQTRVYVPLGWLLSLSLSTFFLVIQCTLSLSTFSSHKTCVCVFMNIQNKCTPHRIAHIRKNLRWVTYMKSCEYTHTPVWMANHLHYMWLTLEQFIPAHLIWGLHCRWMVQKIPHQMDDLNHLAPR